MNFFLPVVVLLLQVQSFTRFTYCKDMSRGPFELQCVELDAEGKGGVRFKRRSADEIKAPVVLSAAARDRFVAAVGATNNLEQANSYESPRPVADLGKKRLTLEAATAKPREATFNYSQRKEVMELVNFFDGVINDETIAFDVENALQFDKLSIPKWVDRIEKELASTRIADPERIISILDKIITDKRLMNYARDRAVKLKEQIQAKKTKGGSQTPAG